MHFEFHVEGGNFSKAGSASSQLKKILKQLNVDPRIVKRVVVALYEAEVNVVAHAYQGIIYIDIDTEKIEIRLVDEGPGIEDIELAMQQGYSTASPEVREMGFGAGMGLPNIKNNSDRLSVTSQVGKGTTVEIITFLNN
ncbi:anti-sigma regulatory factor [Lentimicrobium sp.]|jgi:anti-sigma regulatory factor (Ser/Thr protein kinase)|uniref:ATP-binding protein n=1 Tax=Lentimicrobium sp. TaxID=2034841 RepID=UPI0025E04BB4|nr:anti-sigma regulatory factor [Lentimicrobium sp.]MCO5256525.1 anti-sigma regulatory factor [Lentimicrobium sp.]MCO5263599.1 anti-sigma regulatory factor [Lentimicrobium sp.]HOP14751.1 anti-sigma regulatory factor [Lentimicrobium sp.]HPF64444.1 anti-sigma regulatory factor [Lentimicrobium sp.]HPJ62042.1 anti-sigma regulatory factor [Lentimicrobium sp.]